jgi:hypothetical protein
MAGRQADESGEVPQLAAIEVQHLERGVGALVVWPIHGVPVATVKAANLVV